MTIRYPGLHSLLIVLLTAVVLTSGCSAPKKYIYTEIRIEAPPEAVWQVLANNQRYPEWNPYHVRVDGELKEGNELEVEIHKPNGQQLVIHPHVMRIELHKRLDWGGGIGGIFTGKHSFRLYDISVENSECVHTQLIQDETFAGIVLPFLELDAIQEGYKAMNQALKKRVETLAGCPQRLSEALING